MLAFAAFVIALWWCWRYINQGRWVGSSVCVAAMIAAAHFMGA